MKIVFDNSSIECLSAGVISRMILPSSFLEIRTIGKCLTYKCKRNSEAIILKELDPKNAILNTNSHLDLNVKLECENLFIAVNIKKPYKLNLINHSGRHKAQEMITDEYTFAKISKQISGIPQAIPPIQFTPVEIT
jgi:hypothetical protein